MAGKLKTDWKRIGRSGPTVDGRVIKTEALEQAAKNYKKDLYTALVWPDHLRFFNMGTVEALRTAANDEGGVDLFAKIAPNDIYLSINSGGQRLFTSMELQPNFRKSGEYYLTGLAATDDPASVATSEMRFSKLDDKESLLSAYTENTEHSFSDTEDQPPAWFQKIFKSQHTEDDMDKKALKQLTDQFTALGNRIAALETGGSEGSEGGEQTKPEDYAALSAKVDTLLEKFETLDKNSGADKQAVDSEAFTKLQGDFKDLLEKFEAAVSDEHGTNAGENEGDNFKAESYT